MRRYDRFMVMSFRLKASGVPGVRRALYAKLKGPTFSDLAAQANRALHDGEGVDVTELSREEREKLLLNL
jgi:hypothetical protein